MEKKNAIARANRRHLLEPINVISFTLAIVIALGFKRVGMDEFATGYYLSTSLMIAQVLITRRHRVIIRPGKVILTEPILASGFVTMVIQLLERF